ncbi:TIGR04282 family arsenosugar biosynthesis glycosyltransferase [Fulvivirga sp. 29W222]|uniref:TIGR04282 family arsenosugar biosynthesis glycosyltransferase n=1 Tax=Fulvivirga marina TaxID=2494733 RepID=A0A937FVR9_9BACT|nr:TIGR04282 family arsenosugar biosynthesis glycosyltransferase [Fulvivirga marina]MBL6446939.1 TIGR04282 family arsenosugar biosynthesis glycosyltransferase [Fulvivirga marina]
MSRLLIIFVKNPEVGKVKTRLAKTIGEEAALAVYLKLLTRTHKTVDSVACDKAIYYSGYVDSEDNWDNHSYQKHLQKGENLGQRMENAICESFSMGYNSVCLIGSDIYGLTSGIINNAFTQLATHDVVVGPAEDGGYYLIGMNRPHHEIFQLSQWSTSGVLRETLELIKAEGLTFVETQLLKDIDHAEDLKGTDLI